MTSHMLSQMIILFVQITLVLIVMFEGFNIPHVGSWELGMLLTVAQGFCGMAYGEFK